MTPKVAAFPIVSPVNDWAERRDRERRIRWVVPRASLPFVVGSRASTRVHRVRWTSLRYEAGVLTSASAHVWCGQLIHLGSVRPHVFCGRLLAEPLDGWPVCGTCHGRAIGAGQIDEEGTPLLFSPRDVVWPYAGARCTWTVGGGGAYLYRYGPCGGRARFVAESVHGHALLCRQHRWSAERKGWTVVSADPSAGDGVGPRDLGRLRLAEDPRYPDPPSWPRYAEGLAFDGGDEWGELELPVVEPAVVVRRKPPIA